MSTVLGESLNAAKRTKQNNLKITFRNLYFSFQIDSVGKSPNNGETSKSDSLILQSKDGTSYKITKILKPEEIKNGRIDITFNLADSVSNDEPLTLIHHRGDLDESLIYFKDKNYTELIELAKKENEAAKTRANS